MRVAQKQAVMAQTNAGRLAFRSTSTVPATEYVHNYVIAGAILFPIVIILLVANVLMFSAVLHMILLSKSRKDTCGAVLILNLAVADILLGIAALVNISDAVDPARPLDKCYVTIGFIAMSTMASCLIMAGIAFERYRTIRQPFREKRGDIRMVVVATVFIWVSSALVGFAPFMGWRDETPYTEDGRCLFLSAFPDSYVLFVFFGIYLPTLTATSYLHIVMCQASRKQGRKIAACEILPVWGREATAMRNGSRPATETTDALQGVNNANATSINDGHSEQVSSVYGSVVNVRELPSASPATEPIEITEPGHAMYNIHESNGGRQERNSSNLPRIWNTLKPEKWSRTVILILGFFITMWSPFWIVCVIQASVCVEGRCNYEDLASTYLFVLGVSNSAVNPVVYISTDKKLKDHFCHCFFRSTEAGPDEDSSSVFLSSHDSENA